ncbi:MAG: SEC-C domain-containing protein [Parachlamydiales bacterium]|nr:SEC-C domain-containing protein [Parachlamydiales bacterium]
MKKIGRNDPCVCGSGKKFKKCCERTMIGKRFMATKIDASTIASKTSSTLSSFFQRQVTQIKMPSNESPPINAQMKQNENQNILEETISENISMKIEKESNEDAKKFNEIQTSEKILSKENA